MNLLKRIRKAQKLTQTELALKLGYHVGTINAWEHGRKIPLYTQKVIDSLAEKIL